MKTMISMAAAMFMAGVFLGMVVIGESKPHLNKYQQVILSGTERCTADNRRCIRPVDVAGSKVKALDIQLTSDAVVITTYNLKGEKFKLEDGFLLKISGKKESAKVDVSVVKAPRYKVGDCLKMSTLAVEDGKLASWGTHIGNFKVMAIRADIVNEYMSERFTAETYYVLKNIDPHNGMKVFDNLVLPQAGVDALDGYIGQYGHYYENGPNPDGCKL